MGTHDCSWKQFCVNTLGSFYCVNHTVLCAEGYILNAHRKCVGKLEPLPAARATAVCSAPRQSTTLCHMLKDLSFACELPHSGLLRSVSHPCVPGVLSRLFSVAVFPGMPVTRKANGVAPWCVRDREARCGQQELCSSVESGGLGWKQDPSRSGSCLSQLLEAVDTYEDCGTNTVFT